MEIVRSVKIRTSFSFAISLIDSYTSAPVIGKDHQVYLAGRNIKSIPKNDGYYVFTDLPIQSYQVVVQSKLYMQQTIEIPIELLHSNAPVLYVPLMPNVMYPFGEEATTLAALMKDSQGNPAAHVKARATVTNEACIKAKLAQDVKEDHPKTIFLTQVIGKLIIGDRFLLRNTLGVSEYCRIVAIDESTRCCTLEQPLLFTYEKGSFLFPVMESQSDAKGELVLFFKPNRVQTFGVTLEFTYGNEKQVQEIIMKQAALHNLGIIRLVN